MSVSSRGRWSQIALATQPQIIGTVALGQTIMVLSPVIDAFAAPGTLTSIVPAMGAGFRFVHLLAKLLVVTQTGALTGLPGLKAGTNGAHDNYTPAFSFGATAAQLALALPGDYAAFAVTSLAGKTNVNGSPELTSDVIAEQVTAATGAATLTYRIAISGMVVAFP